MKNKEALKWCLSAIEKINSLDINADEKQTALDSLRKCSKALTKQIARKPKRKRTALLCPICENPIIETPYGNQKHCDECGQAIDWSEI